VLLEMQLSQNQILTESKASQNWINYRQLPASMPAVPVCFQ
jgi:hypothetical protein